MFLGVLNQGDALKGPSGGYGLGSRIRWSSSLLHLCLLGYHSACLNTANQSDTSVIAFVEVKHYKYSGG